MPAPASFLWMLREVFGPSELEDFQVYEFEDGWTFLYEPLQLVTGRILKANMMHAMRRLHERRDTERWLRDEVKKACDVSPLRVMQIAQVGL